MSSPDGNRRLKAIMFTDIKGYSAMMGQDESRTVKAVLEHREIVRECLKDHDGTEHETIGDAFVVLFDSVVNAVRCGAEIQARLKARNDSLPKEEQVWLRIGIHLGDIIVQGDGIYGDGVNVAARVQDKAEPGGISITEQVFLQIDGKIDLAMEPVGKVELKNIRNPPSLYRLKLDGAQPLVKHRSWVAPVAAAALVIGGIGLAVALNNRSTPAPVAAAAPAVAPAPVAPPAPAPVVVDPKAEAKVAAGQKVTEALGTSGQARVDLLRQALALDPDNPAVQNLLVVAMQALPAAAPTPTAAPAPAAVAEPARPAGPRAAHPGKPKGDDDTKIKRSVVVE
ncbi:MAG: adenylate/guanylate cyclase domain-containing protein [Deltaproteobacteria bacterium]|nr:adenylate/guanylate cyclase domain-containing protein [Deltaproteobacteria bacterium]